MTSNIILLENAYIGNGIKKPDKYIEKLKKGKSIKEFFIVVFPEDSKRLEIMSSRLFLQKYYRDKWLRIVALVDSYDDALEYIRCVTHISYERYDSFMPYETIMHITKENIDSLFNCTEDD